jgi:hypothetical protein
MSIFHICLIHKDLWIFAPRTALFDDRFSQSVKRSGGLRRPTLGIP